MEPILTEEMINSAVNALKNERFLKGKSVNEFENYFSEFTGVNHAIAVNSGTTALHLSLIAMGIKSGDYVITTSATFIATANAIAYLHAKPVFVDISIDTYNIDPQGIEDAVRKHGDKVKAIVPVHLYGYPCEIDAILEIAEKCGLKVLEDACQAHGAMYRGQKVGSFGDAGAFSFYPSKNMTVAGDGGMITTNNEEIAEIVRSLRDVGRSKAHQYLHEYIGYTARMNTVNAAIGKIQVKYLEEWNEARRRIAKEYNRKLDGMGDIILPPKCSSKIKPVYHLYVIRTQYRDSLKEFLESRGVECGIHYPIPVHLQPPYRKIGYHEGMFPNTEKWAKEVLSLPMHPNLSNTDIEYIVTCIEDFFRVVK
ncbi:DegT/DnrJ/EryC1/StrS family aminotransferase [Archaeoglobus veneficus]|nr:DegT/DnrJ/EryC1/StrS family aminotransferase [Archaeoglobus veneficus]